MKQPEPPIELVEPQVQTAYGMQDLTKAAIYWRSKYDALVAAVSIKDPAAIDRAQAIVLGAQNVSNVTGMSFRHAIESLFEAVHKIEHPNQYSRTDATKKHPKPRRHNKQSQ